MTGRPGTRAGNPSESAGRLALADARRRALARAAARLQERADIKALKLSPGHLEAFTIVLVDVVEPASETTSGRSPSSRAWMPTAQPAWSAASAKIRT